MHVLSPCQELKLLLLAQLSRNHDRGGAVPALFVFRRVERQVNPG